MLDQINTSNSIIVLANYRTGSTAFCDYLAKKFNMINLDEVFHPKMPTKLIKFQKLQEQNVKTIIKVMPDQIPDQVYFDYILSKSFVIGLYRTNVTEQMASFYISHMTQVWHNNTKEFCVEINNAELENQYRYINDMNNKYQELKSLLNLQFCYEDIRDQLYETNYNVNVKPTNYAALLDKIRNLKC